MIAQPVAPPGPVAKRIAVVLPALLPLAGLERVVLSLTSEFTARGYLVDVVLVNGQKHTTIRLPDGARILDFALPRLRSFLRPFVKYLRDTRPDAVLVSLWPLTSICCVAHRIARSSSRLVICDHNNLSLQYRPRGLPTRLALATSLRSTYRLADAHVSCSAGVASDVVAISGLSNSKTHVIHNPMPLLIQPELDYAQVEAAWRGWTGRRILSVGIMKRQKNHHLLIRAFQLIRRNVEAKLMIVGGGECEAATRQLVESEGLHDEVLLPGRVDEPGPFYARADVFVLSSDYEGFGNVLIEALAFGCPVVSTDCPFGPAEILEKGKWGRLTPIGDVDALATAMIETLSVSHDREALKRRAADFSPAKAAERYLAVLFP